MIYVASSWKNLHQQGVVGALRNKGFSVYDFRHPSVDNNGFSWRHTTEALRPWDIETYLDALDHPAAVDGFRLDWEAMQASSACVLVLPCGRSAHLEAGYFVGAMKPLAILLDGTPIAEPELMYKMAGLITDDLRFVVEFLQEYGFK